MTQPKQFIYKRWWKVTCVVLLVYTFTMGLLYKIPAIPALEETIRNLYFHVCMWFAMMILFTISVVHSIRYLRSFDLKYDIYARQYAGSGILMGLLGYATGAIWMSYTWADPNNPTFESFIGLVLLGGWGLSLIFTFLAAIAARAQQNAAIMAVLGFPIITPQLILLMKISNAAFNPVLTLKMNDILLLVALDAMVALLAVILFPFLWKE